MASLILHSRTLLRALERLLQTPLATLMTVTVMAIAVSLLGGLYLLLHNLSVLGGAIQTAPQITVFAAPATDPRGLATLRQDLLRLPATDAVDFVSQDEALAQLAQRHGLRDLTAGLDHNPLPDAFIVHLKSPEAERTEALAQRIRQLPNVAETRYDAAWTKRLQALVRFGEQLVLLISGVFALALVLINSNTIRLQILVRREEIAVADLIGATRAFVARPFLYAGLLQGALAGGLSVLLLWGATAWLHPSAAAVAEALGLGMTLQGLTAGDIAALVGFAALLGWAGAWLALGQTLRQITHPS